MSSHFGRACDPLAPKAFLTITSGLRRYPIVWFPARECGWLATGCAGTGLGMHMAEGG